MKPIKFLLLAINFLSFNLLAQYIPVYGCGTEIINTSTNGDAMPRYSSPLPLQSNCNKSAGSFNDYFKRPDNFMPHPYSRPGVSLSAHYPNRIEPRKFLVINVVFFGEDDGTGYPDNPNANTDISNYSLVNTWLNEAYRSTSPSSCTPIHNISFPNTGIEIKINKLYHYPSSTLLHATQNGVSPSTAASNALSHHFSHNPDAVNQLNCIVFQYCGIPGAMGFASTMNYQGTTIPYVSSGSNYFAGNYNNPWATGYSY